MSLEPASPTTPDDLIALVERQVAQAQEHADQTQALADNIAAVRAKASSPGKEVTLSVDVSGRIAELEFDTSALSLSTRDLASVVLTAVDTAQRTAARQVMAMTNETFGEGSGLSQQVRGEYEARLGPDFDADDEDGIRW